MYAIETENLSKSYDDVPALRGVTLQVAQGEVYGLLGPNGAGKSTLIHVLLGFLKPSAGRVRVLGTSNLEMVHGRVGYLPERLRYHTRYSAREYLRFLGQFSDMEDTTLRERIEEELERVGLGDAADRLLATFSKGMLQRLGVAQALLDDPDLLLIDEPTSGLDPAGQHEVLDLLAEVRSHGHTILLCTHYMDEIEQLCDRVGVLVNGRLAIESEVPKLRAPGTSIAIQVDQLAPELQTRLSSISPAVQCGQHTIILRPNNQPLQVAVIQALLDAGVAILALDPLESPLERIYRQAVSMSAESFEEASPMLNNVPNAVRKPVRRRSEGDTLLNELLNYGGKTRSNREKSGQDEASSKD